METAVIYVIILGVISAATGQQVDVEPHVFFYPGQTVNLHCALTDATVIQITQVTWTYEVKEGERIYIAVFHPEFEPNYPDSPVKGRVSFSPSPPNLDSPSIQISNVMMTDERNYTCSISTFPDGNKEGTTSLVMLKPIVNASVTSLTNQPVEGNSVNLTCEAAGSVFAIKWMKDGADLIQTDRVLSFQSLKITDSGNYSCNISNPLSSVAAEYIMVVNYGPENVQIKGPSTISLNETLTLTCSAECTPTANYTWKLNETKILNNSAVLTKHITDLSDSGKYTCEAMNRITEKTSSAVHGLTVTQFLTGKPHGFLSAGAIAAIVITICFIAAGGAAGGYYIYKKKNKKDPPPHNTEQEENTYENI